MQLRLIKDRVLVRQSEKDAKSQGGILLTDRQRSVFGTRGEVLAAGPDVDPEVKVGVVALFNVYAGISFKPVGELGELGDSLLFLREQDLIALIDS